MKNNINLFIVVYLIYVINLNLDFGIFKVFLYFLVGVFAVFTNTKIEFDKLTERKTKIEYTIIVFAVGFAVMITNYFLPSILALFN
jgi:hypothetical protein